MTTIPLRLPNAEGRLLAKRIITPSGCWEWNGYKDRDGYGFVSIAGKEWRTHRLSAALWLGFDLTSRLFICHKCDNPPCFNPDHLFLGTPADNTADMIAKGRLVRKAIHARTKACEACGKEYAPSGDHRGRSVVCSMACVGPWRALTQKGRGAKLSPSDVEVARGMIAAGNRYKDVGLAFGVSGSCVHRHINGRSPHA